METFPDASPFGTLRPAGTDFQKMWQEARSRWLRPSEIYDVLTNHFRFSISREPLNLPPSGTLVLFDRKLLRNFRRDGHPWRKKKDNKTVKEAHEHLKVGSEEKIHVYYAHGEDGSHLQRRVYWLLDKSLEHIVLVHYLEVKEAPRVNTFFRQHPPLQTLQRESGTTYNPSLYFEVREPVLSSGSSAGAASTPPLEFSELNSNDDEFDTFSLEDLRSTGETGFGSTHLEAQWLNTTMGIACQQISDQSVGNFNNTVCWNNTSQMVIDPPRPSGHREEQSDNGMQLPTSCISFQTVFPDRAPMDLQIPLESQVYVPLSTSHDVNMKVEDTGFSKRENNVSQVPAGSDLSLQMPLLENGDEVLKKLDSLDRWMQRELPVENKLSPLTPSANSCCVLDTAMYEDKYSEDGTQMGWQSNITEEMTPSCLPRFFFEITDYSPSWSFATESAKVIITGHLNGDTTDFDKVPWWCMFGDKELQAEIVQPGVLRCKTPDDAVPGMVSFYIMDGSKQACSDVKNFEFRVCQERKKPTADPKLEQGHENARLQHRLAHLLLGSNNRGNTFPNKKFGGSNSAMSSVLRELTDALEQEWLDLDDLLNTCSHDLSEVKELLLQLVFKCMMANLIGRIHTTGGNGWRSFDPSGQAAVHLASALGYEWVISLLKASGMSIDFRDKMGWTALHWAAYHGRERMVAALLAAGASPGVASDPTPSRKLGCTPADVAAEAGHEGLAGYLSEQDLTSHLKTLTLAENERDKESADEEGHRVVEYLKRSMSLRRSVKTREDELALEDSLSAIGNATTVSARIHSAFKEYFMRERLHAIEEVDESGVSVEEQLAVQKIQKAYRYHRERKQKENAALQIQNRFRVWKTRKSFLCLKQNTIKIQAYYRMHRARTQYHRLIWSVGILEKALLRWRQHRKGLRGYQAEAALSLDGKEGNDFLQIGRKQAEDALDRAVVLVQSMVRSRLAREQYRRMKESVAQAKLAQTQDQGEKG